MRRLCRVRQRVHLTLERGAAGGDLGAAAIERFPEPDDDQHQGRREPGATEEPGLMSEDARRTEQEGVE